MSNSPRIVYAPRRDATPEAELDVLTACYRFVLFDSQASKGGLHDLTSNSTKKWTTRPDKPDKKGRNADLHSD
jgi:hypothetical protein